MEMLNIFRNRNSDSISYLEELKTLVSNCACLDLMCINLQSHLTAALLRKW